MRRLLIVLAVMIVGPATAYVAGPTLLRFALTRADPYPAFMADYRTRNSRSYNQARRKFSDFLGHAFPVGSAAVDAIERMTEDGFKVVDRSDASVRLVWSRHAGPCGELYSIMIGKGADGSISEINGDLRPACL